MNLLSSFDSTDLLVVVIIGAIGIYLFFKNRSNDVLSTAKTPNSTSYASTSPATPTDSLQKEKGLAARLKNEGRQVLILFGSQTGTAEEVASRLAKDMVLYQKKALVIDPEEIEAEDLLSLKSIPDPLLIVCAATYGEGDPTDNAQALYEQLSQNDFDLSGIKFAVFGLGNKTYEHYNAVAKFFDRRLEELGAERVYELGLGDDDGNLEEDFMRWREAFLSAVGERFNWEMTALNGTQRQFRLDVIENRTGAIFTGEFGRIGAYKNQRPPYDQKNPYYASIVAYRELHKPASDRSCLHIEFELGNSRLRYEAGDHLAVYPTNDEKQVTRIGELLDADLDVVFKLINTDEDSNKRHPFPCPTSYRMALRHYVDINAPVKSHVLRAISEFASDSEEKAKLVLLSTATDEGLKLYSQFISHARRNIIDVLEHFKTCKPPIDFLLELLPRLQVRYYSISSSPKVDSNIVAITAVVTRYNIGDRQINGVCTHFFSQLNVGSAAPIYVRKSAMRLPHRLNFPIIMIGPGTGLAPFRGFLQERDAQKQAGKEFGEMHLFFGCRHPDQDYIYQEELEAYKESGIIRGLHLALSRVTEKKTYVQHLVWENRVMLWKLLTEEMGYIYVCGDARNMARDVQATLIRIFTEVGGLDSQVAQTKLKEMERQRRYQADVWS